MLTHGFSGWAIAASLLLAGGCQSVGPATVPRDRFDYSEAIGNSWKQQMLLNVVKLRYADVPIFVDVGQVVAGYSLETGVTVQGVLSSDGAVQGDNVAIGGQGRFIDRPTITYMPMTGSQYIGNLMSPISPASIFTAMQSGWAADVLLLLGVDSVNGLYNERTTRTGYQPADPRFIRVAETLRSAQLSGALSIRVRQEESGKTTLLVLRDPDVSESSAAELRELRELLGLQEGTSVYELQLGDRASGKGEIAVQARSLLKILQVLGNHVDVPASHIAEGRTLPGAEQGGGPGTARSVQIHSSIDDPGDDAFVVARYRGYYFYIDDRDMRSKGIFSLIMLLYALAEAGAPQTLPTLTIPTQ